MLGEVRIYPPTRGEAFGPYPYSSRRGQRTPTNRSGGSLAATASATCAAGKIAADAVLLDSRQVVTAYLAFSTTGGRIAQVGVRPTKLVVSASALGSTLRRTHSAHLSQTLSISVSTHATVARARNVPEALRLSSAIPCHNSALRKNMEVQPTMSIPMA